MYPPGICRQLTVLPLQLLHMRRLQKWFVKLHLDLQFHKLSDTFLIPAGTFYTLYVTHTPASSLEDHKLRAIVFI